MIAIGFFSFPFPFTPFFFIWERLEPAYYRGCPCPPDLFRNFHTSCSGTILHLRDTNRETSKRGPPIVFDGGCPGSLFPQCAFRRFPSVTHVRGHPLQPSGLVCPNHLQPLGRRHLPKPAVFVHFVRRAPPPSFMIPSLFLCVYCGSVCPQRGCTTRRIPVKLHPVLNFDLLCSARWSHRKISRFPGQQLRNLVFF